MGSLLRGGAIDRIQDQSDVGNCPHQVHVDVVAEDLWMIGVKAIFKTVGGSCRSTVAAETIAAKGAF